MRRIPFQRHASRNFRTVFNKKAARLGQIGGGELERRRLKARVKLYDLARPQKIIGQGPRVRPHSDSRRNHLEARRQRRRRIDPQSWPNPAGQLRHQFAIGTCLTGIGNDGDGAQVRLIILGRAIPMQIKGRQVHILHRIFRHRAHEEHQIKAPFQQRRPQVERNIDGQVHIDARILRAEGLEELRQPGLRDGLGCADAEQALRFRRVGHALLDLFLNEQHLFGIKQQQGAMLGQNHIACAAFKQGHAQLVFEICDTGGHGRLGQMQPLGGLAKPTKPGHPEKGLDLIKGHI
mmetsp:Transcript_4654/g.7366  ORF Transcript_4654/g.7366 Transcript_4654/m.7366 type:complete len:292 (+) Transcript_4654:2574-3449(+)